MNKRSDIEQEIANHMKLARMLIVAKHRLAADTEINNVLPGLHIQLQAQAQRGELRSLSGAELLQIAAEYEESISAAD